MEPCFDAYRAIKPYLITSGNPPTRERIQSQTDRDRIDDTTKLHPVRVLHDELPGVLDRGQLHRPRRHRQRAPVHLRHRDEGAAERLDILNEVDGAWRCRTTFNCPSPTRAASRCPIRSRSARSAASR